MYICKLECELCCSGQLYAINTLPPNWKHTLQSVFKVSSKWSQSEEEDTCVTPCITANNLQMTARASCNKTTRRLGYSQFLKSYSMTSNTVRLSIVLKIHCHCTFTDNAISQITPAHSAGPAIQWEELVSRETYSTQRQGSFHQLCMPIC